MFFCFFLFVGGASICLILLGGLGFGVCRAGSLGATVGAELQLELFRLLSPW